MVGTERELGVRITATDVSREAAQSALGTLNQIRDASNKLKVSFDALSESTRINALANAGVSQAAYAAALALEKQAAQNAAATSSSKAATAALREQAAAIAVVHRTLQEGINASGGGVEFDRQIKSASQSANILATSLSAAASADALLREEAQRTAAALARQNELMSITAVRGLSAAEFGGVVTQRAGVRSNTLSAKESASVFEKELGEVGTGLTLTAAQGFSKLAAELAGVKQSYLSAADSAKVFADAGLLGKGGLQGGGQLGNQYREIRHVTAAFDELARGQKGQLVGTIGAGLRDAGLSSGALLSTFGAFVALMAGAAIVRGIENMARWAETVRSGAAATGMSVAQFSQLQGAFQLVGGKADEGDIALRHFADAVAKAASDADSKAAKAFHALGISQKEIVDGQNDVSGLLSKVAGNWTEFANSANKAAAGEELFGRGVQKVGELLDRGSDGIEKLKKQAEALGLTLTDNTSKSLTETGTQIDVLLSKSGGDFKKGMIEWQPEIRKVIELLGDASTALGWVLEKSGKMTNFVAQAYSHTPFGQRNAPDFTPIPVGPSSAFAQVPSFEGKNTGMESADSALEKAFEAVRKSMSAGRDVIEEMAMAQREAKEAIEAADEAERERTRATRDAIRYNMDEARSILDVIEAQERQQRQQIANIRQGAGDAEARMGASKASASFSAVATGHPAGGGNEAAAQAQAILAEAQQEIQALMSVMNSAQSTAEVREEAAREILKVTADAETKMVDLFKSTGKAGADAADVFMNAWKQALTGLDQGLDTFAQDVTKAFLVPKQELIKAGLTTIHVNLEGQEIRAAAQKVFLGLASDFVGSVVKGLDQLAAKGLANLFGQTIEPGTGLGGLAAQSLGIGGDAGKAAQFGITAANLTAFNTALTTATATLSGHTAATTTATATTTANTAATTVSTAATTTHSAATTTDTGGIFSHISATASDTLAGIEHAAEVAYDTAAEVIHAAVTLLGFSGGGVVPSAAGGMVVGGGLGGAGGGILSILHPNEMVLPKHLSEGVQGMINRGNGNGGTSNSARLNYSPTINAGRGGGGLSRSEFSQMLASSAGSMIGEARNMIKKGWRP